MEDGMLLGDFKIHFISFKNGVMIDSSGSDITIRGMLELSESNWETIFVQEINAGGEVYNTFYQKVGRKYVVLYPKKKAN